MQPFREVPVKLYCHRPLAVAAFYLAVDMDAGIASLQGNLQFRPWRAGDGGLHAASREAEVD